MNDLKLYSKIDLDRLLDFCHNKKAKRVGLQFQEDHLYCALNIAKYLKDKSTLNTDFLVISDIARSPCCVDFITAEQNNCDLIAHFGEVCSYPKREIEVFYVYQRKEIRDKIKSIKETIKKLREELVEFDTAVVLWDFEYLHAYNKTEFDDFRFSKILSLRRDLCCESLELDEEQAQNVLFFMGRKSTFLEIFVLANRFKMVYGFQTTAGGGSFELIELNINSLLAKRFYLIEMLKEVKVVGIIIATCTQDMNLDTIEYIKKLVRHSGKRVYMLSLGRILGTKLENFPDIDIFISVSCLLNSLVLPTDFPKLVANLLDAEIAFLPGKEWTGNYDLSGKVFDKDENGLLLRKTDSASVVDPECKGILSETHKSEIRTAKGKMSYFGMEEADEDEELQPAKIEEGKSGIAMDYNECF